MGFELGIYSLGCCKMGWSKWCYFELDETKKIDTIPGIYKVRYTSNKKSVPLQRVGGKDKKGIVYIGKAAIFKED